MQLSSLIILWMNDEKNISIFENLNSKIDIKIKKTYIYEK